jgi:ferric-dicitrate binding protein FerR (iron transport regulator)
MKQLHQLSEGTRFTVAGTDLVAVLLAVHEGSVKVQTEAQGRVVRIAGKAPFVVSGGVTTTWARSTPVCADES